MPKYTTINITLGSVASILTATLSQGNPDRNHKLWNIGSIERYILYMQVLLECCYILMESTFNILKFSVSKDLVDRYGISMSQMTTDMFHLS
jgi:hypothetical protein